MKYLFLLLLTLQTFVGFSQWSKPFIDTLKRMVVADQQAASLPPDGISLDSPDWLHFKDSVFTSHKGKLEILFNKNGFPGYDKVGKEASNHFWLLVQHLDKWPDFQQRVLTAMSKEVLKKNASPSDFAYLTDRVRLNTGKQQLYGTQLTYNTDSCQAYPKPLEDAINVNARRKAVGLGPLEEYMNGMSEMHFEMNKEGYEKKGIKEAKKYVVPRR